MYPLSLPHGFKLFYCENFGLISGKNICLAAAEMRNKPTIFLVVEVAKQEI